MSEPVRLTLESWRPVVGLPYEVSDHGRVRREGDGAKSGKTIKLTTHKAGYPKATLWLNGLPKTVLIHRLVLESFVGPPPSKGYQCNHINSVRSDNRVRNLEWVTAAENTRHAIEVGMRRGGESHWSAKLSEGDVPEIRRSVESGETLACVAHRYGISKSSVFQVVHRKTWKNV